MTNGNRNDDMDLFDSLFTQMKENLTLPSFELLGMFTQNSINICVRSRPDYLCYGYEGKSRETEKWDASKISREIA